MNDSRIVLSTLQKWPWVILSFLVGALVALVISLIVPTSYRAEARINVMYNADAIFRNPDDYKNWEMEQLDVVVYSTPVLEKTLARLQVIDPYWREYKPTDLPPHLHAYWRNAGVWRLVAKASTPQHASQLAQTWNQSVLETVQQALVYGDQMNQTARQIQVTNNALLTAEERLIELSQLKASLQDWYETAAGQDQTTPVVYPQDWKLYAQVARIAPFDRAGEELLDAAPPPNSQVSQYLPWVERAILLSEGQIIAVQNQQNSLRGKLAELNYRWNELYTASLGLSSYLRVEALSSDQLVAQPTRSQPLAALVGGVLGVLLWVSYWFVRIFLREQS